MMTVSETMDRNRMDTNTFHKNFTQRSRATFLCYEVESGGDRVPEDQRMDVLRNQGSNTGNPIHAEVLFLERVRSWNLDPEVACRITCFISWSPCLDCAGVLTDFLKEHPQVELDIRAAKIYGKMRGFKSGLQALRAAGANISIMTRADYEHCWGTFVQNDEEPFNPQTISDENINRKSMNLENIFREFVVLPPWSPAPSSKATQDDKEDDPKTVLTEEISKE